MEGRVSQLLTRYERGTLTRRELLLGSDDARSGWYEHLRRGTEGDRAGPSFSSSR